MATALCSSKKESQEGDRDAAVKAILLQSELHTLPEGRCIVFRISLTLIIKLLIVCTYYRKGSLKRIWAI